MNHSMYGVDRLTDMNCFSLSAIAAMVAHSPIVVSRSAYRTSVPNGYEREFWNGFGACHNKLTPPLLRRAVAHHKKSVIAPGSSASFHTEPCSICIPTLKIGNGRGSQWNLAVGKHSN